ncbi:MAG: HAMP domain-containing histidine kinase [Lachnospiraceae bacterium]|nr:HAMP domain-containing histidine kinase [Lachnospiraceae bacterium]
MGILQEKSTRMYAVFLMYLMAALIVWTCFLCWLHGKEVQSLLFEREQTMVSSLVEQGISRVSIARAVRSAESTGEGEELLRQLGHTQSVSFRLFPAIDRSVRLFGKTAVGMAGVLVLLLLGVTACFLWEREKLYRQAEGIITQFSDGNFACHLPQNESGSVYQLFAAVEELAVALRAKSEGEQRGKAFLRDMISDISHQLKTPLAALHMYTEIIAEEPDRKETVERFSPKTMQSLERIEQLVQTLLKVSRIDAGSIVFHREWQSASGLAESAAADLAVRAQQEGKQLVMEGDPAQMLFCDREWTREAVANLIKNALDHTGEGGTVTVVWEQSPGMFRLSVADDGCGIAAEDMSHVFKRFYRSKRDGGRPGLGLGLPLAKSIVEGQGGMLSVSSTPGQGAIFTISFFMNDSVKH